MVIQLVSYLSSLRADERLHLTAEIINQSQSDLILFAGCTLESEQDVYSLAQLIDNETTCAILEVGCDKSNLMGSTLNNALYKLQDGVFRSMYTGQLFATSADIDDNPDVCEHLILELETRRKVTVANRQAVVLQCGENNILRNIQGDRNRAEFRFQSDSELHNRFEEVINHADIILNPMHSPMRNQGKMARRREYFSAENRAYFSTANFDDAHSINYKSLQYACINGVEQEPTSPISPTIGEGNTYLSRTYII
jgi:hypothetical protein